ncbi:unnamed protein product [Didymodactylos carnosus]|uniref:TRAF1-6 MATH domain-containing protein n=1 Tax=Didymodactylos carnosus TaxID=1234261 RepID=A0A8S2ETU7_9BILA|nr:unnamed protein product [Didymodactylos carnosus]CAF4044442.1 unnamed protein product [Didymodactylos carnosus]
MANKPAKTLLSSQKHETLQEPVNTVSSPLINRQSIAETDAYIADIRPFDFKVTFCLYDQSGQQRHIIDSFRPDTNSNSFQRPRSEMNIASGIPKFFPLSMIIRDDNHYIKNDTMFIKCLIDFSDISKIILPYVLSLNPALPHHVQRNMIRVETERRVQLQQQSTSPSGFSSSQITENATVYYSCYEQNVLRTARQAVNGEPNQRSEDLNFERTLCIPNAQSSDENFANDAIT